MPTDLHAPFRFRTGAIARNRLWLAPLTNQQSHADGTLSAHERRWLARRAEGGFGVVETAAAFVMPSGRSWPGQLGVHDDATLPGLGALADTLRAAGSLGIVQLFHGGVRSPSSQTGQQPMAASVFHEDNPRFEVPRAATPADLEAVVTAFAAGAARAARAGFDGVELHGAHGYLLSGFLSRTMNTRDDAWGRDLAGRARLLRDTLAAVRAAVPARFLVGVRLSLEDFGFAKGLDLDDSVQVAAWLVEAGADFLHLSLWDGAAPTTKRPGQHPVTLVREAVGGSVPIVAAGGVFDAADAQALLDRGADLVAVGRAAIANPAWADRLALPGWSPHRFPLTEAELAARDVSPAFVAYLRERFKAFVAA